MIFLILTLCTSAAMDDCRVVKVGQYPAQRQCEQVAAVHRQVLGAGPKQNYRLECVRK